MALQLVPSKDEQTAEHVPVCSVDGEPWPCRHHRRTIHAAASQRFGVRCRACGRLRNYWTSLNIEKGLDGQAVYFHDRKRCRPKAEQWWDENVKPHTGEPFTQGTGIDDLARYIGVRCQPKVIECS